MTKSQHKNNKRSAHQGTITKERVNRAIVAITSKYKVRKIGLLDGTSWGTTTIIKQHIRDIEIYAAQKNFVEFKVMANSIPSNTRLRHGEFMDMLPSLKNIPFLYYDGTSRKPSDYATILESIRCVSSEAGLVISTMASKRKGSNRIDKKWTKKHGLTHEMHSGIGDGVQLRIAKNAFGPSILKARKDGAPVSYIIFRSSSPGMQMSVVFVGRKWTRTNINFVSEKLTGAVKGKDWILDSKFCH